MDSAIHKKTGREYFAPRIWKKGLFENEDVHKEQWIAPSDEIQNYDELNEEIKVTPVVSHTRKNSFIPSFFRLSSEYTDKVILIKESDLHKRAKTVVSVLLTEEFNCSLRYDKEAYPIEILPIDFDKLQKNIRKREVTKKIISTDEYKRADVLIPFIFSPFWGNGIVIEISISEGDERKEEKENFWFQRGFSLGWLNKDDFTTEDGQLGLNKNIIDVVPFSIGYKKILDDHIEKMQSFLHEGWENINNFIDTLEEKKQVIFNDFDTKLEFAKKTCRTCKYGTKNKKEGYEGTIACWFGTLWGRGRGKGYGNHPTIREPLDGCNKHENR